MKTVNIVLVSLMTVGILFISPFAVDNTVKAEMKAGDISKGMILFKDPSFGSSKNRMSCNTCHPNGRGLEKAGDKTDFAVMGAKQGSLEAVVNFCIVNPLKGKAIDMESEDMKDIVAYIKSLK
jgi:cytochrome c